MSRAPSRDTDGAESSADDFFLRWAATIPVPARRPRPDRRTFQRIAVALVVASFVIGSVVAALLLLADDPIRGPIAAQPSSPVPTGGVATPTGGATGAAPGADVPGLTMPGIHVDVVPSMGGELEVVEQVLFRGNQTRLELALPTLKGLRADARPRGMRIEDLRVAGDGRPVTVDAGSLVRGGSLLLSEAPRTVELRYRLTGAVVATRQSSRGRVLVVLPPVATGDNLRGLPTVVEARGSRIRNLVCPGLLSSEQVCGRQSPGTWTTVQVTRSATAVVAQLDLPPP